MPEITPERWGDLYDHAFPQVYRALVAATFDRERALDGLHDAFEEGLRHPPSDDRNLEGWLYRVALRKTRRGLFQARRNVALDAGSSTDEVNAIIQRLEVGRLLALLTERQRAIVRRALLPRPHPGRDRRRARDRPRHGQRDGLAIARADARRGDRTWMTGTRT